MAQGDHFEGVIERDVRKSMPWWPEPVLPRAGSPNVVVVLLDDTGFGHFGCYGSLIDTPTFDRLAAGGLRYVNFTTNAVCSPTRASLLTGRNHHSIGMSFVANFDTGFPNMRGGLPDSAATLAHVLRDVGYATFCVGKWHIAPGPHCSAAGPFEHWPLRKGFDRYYGFLGGETDQFHPELVCDNRPVDPPRTAAQGYHLTEDLVDQAIAMINDTKSLVPERPFFLYVAPGATHAPHQAPDAYLRKYRGRFDEGWDAHRERVFARQKAMGVVPRDTVLPPRNPGVVAWDELSVNARRVACRFQEAFAAFLDHTDHELGRLVDHLDATGELDNTLFMVLSDNGASQEGGALGVLDEMKFFQGIEDQPDEMVGQIELIGTLRSHPNYPWGWSMVGNTPNKRYKQNVHGGGIRDPLVVHWPAVITDRGGVRTQLHHVIDVMPTVLEVVGLTPRSSVGGVAQMPMHGVSMRYSFDAPASTSTRRTQYYEMFGHRAIIHDGWKAVTYHPGGAEYEDDQWELYHLAEDFSEAHDLAAVRPDKLEELVEQWWVEAGRYDVLPLDDRWPHQMPRVRRAGEPSGRAEFAYRPPMSHVPIEACPQHGPRPFVIEAEVDLTATTEGVIVNRGTGNGGYALFVKDRRLHFDHNFFHSHSRASSTRDLPLGECTLGVRVESVGSGGAGRATLTVDGAAAGQCDIPQLARTLSSLGMDIGRCVAPVCDDYDRPFAFTGALRVVRFTLPAGPSKTAAEIIADTRQALGLH
jgi:arylsulfatase